MPLALKLAPYVLLVVLGLTTLLYRAKAEQAHDRAEAAEAALASARQDLKLIDKMRGAADELVKTQQDELAKQTQQTELARQAIRDLSDAKTRTYLDTTIPDDVRRLLNNSK